MAIPLEYAQQFVGRPISDLPTPCLTLDAPRLEANLTTLQTDISRAGKSLRAHAKSHKCTRLARLQQEHGAIGICAAKLSEAEGLVAAGLRGVLLTGPIASAEAIERLARLHQNGADLTITLGSESNARRIAHVLEAAGDLPPLPFLLDLDIGQHRTGCAPEEAISLTKRLATLKSLKMIGVQAYAGHLQHLLSRKERARVNADCLGRAIPVFRELRSDDITIFSVGGTGSYEFDLAVPEVTEVQPGSYALMDADYLAVEPSKGEAWKFHPALQLRSTVLSERPNGDLTLDAGLKSLYRDGPSPLVTEPNGLLYDWFGDEYGRLTGDRSTLARLTEGSVVSLTVSHCDPTVNLFDGFYLVEKGLVIDYWPIDLRGCSH